MRLSYLLSSVFALSTLGLAPAANAFCGFYVAKAETDLFNSSSKVALVRDGDRTVITMANDYQGDPTEFAMVIPVPTVITKEQVHVSDPALLEHLDAYTAPRLVEYFDDNPCDERKYRVFSSAPMMDGAVLEKESSSEALGVTIEEKFSVGEYDILVLSASQSDGLQIWLDNNGYKVPEKAKSTLGSYIKQDMKFFVAKVNLEAKAKAGGEMLRPIAVAYESPKFMLPIRLGTVNAKGDQDLFVYALTRKGKVETTNYRTIKIPSDKELPIFIKDDFGRFYKDMYATAAEREGGHGVFMEYAWDMNWCDPCAADPLSRDELQELGVFWINDSSDADVLQRGRPMPQAQDVYVTRLHVRYDAESFPEDLKFKTTGDRQNFQGRYILRHAFEGEMQCEAAKEYKIGVNKRKDEEVKTLANLTGWQREDIFDKIKESGMGQKFDVSKPVKDTKWWNKIWPGDE
ncbi:hypothetical protein DES40_0841 [Litorimonas taeanensis]|uniref:DUF2330 domain-containing protein n=1 Tax=Litorimonas taeanensis TaxID=568099 RepID=A0A420WKI3_9PROT|nr:DUF2330 domain-containing protein [Litorimonas taeanensis]RKQ71518.1 hypothetical protein DES40_0841 [Litorimonas taeanensis]